MFGSLLHGPASKLIFLGVLVGMWQIFVAPAIDPIITIIQYGFNFTLYKIFAESTLQFILDAVYTVSTVKVFLWVFAPDLARDLTYIDGQLTGAGFVTHPVSTRTRIPMN